VQRTCLYVHLCGFVGYKIPVNESIRNMVWCMSMKISHNKKNYFSTDLV